MHIFVTGGAGFIGSAHVPTLLQDDVASGPVHVPSELSYSGNDDKLPQTRLRLWSVRGDITGDHPVRELRPGPDAIVPFAAESPVDRSIAESIPLVRTNALGTRVLLDAARAVGTRRFVHMSTGPAAAVAWCRDNRSWWKPLRVREAV